MFLIEKSHSPSFSPFGRVFNPSVSNDFDLISRSFDENILRRLKALCLSSNQPSISLSWLSLAVDFLSSTHTDAQILISNLTSSSRSMNDSLALYLDYSVKLLDICNLISSQIERLRQRRLLVNFVLHLLKFPSDGEIPTPEKLRRARESLSDWENNSRGFAKGRNFQNIDPEAFIRDLAVGLERAPRAKISSVDKIVRRTIYAVGLLTVFIAGVAASALYGLPHISKVRVPAEFLWAGSFNDLQSAIYKETEQRFLVSERKGSFLELDGLAARANGVRDVIDGVVSGGSRSDKVKKKKQLESAVKELGTATERFSEGLDRLYNGVNDMFNEILHKRDDVIENFRVDHEKPNK